jgi:hypothetical protein
LGRYQSSTMANTLAAWIRQVTPPQTNLLRIARNTLDGHAIRCLRD